MRFSDAWQEVSEVNTTFASDQRAQLRAATRAIGENRVVFLFHPDKNLFLYRDEQGAEHVADYRQHLFLHDRALELDFEEDSFIPTPNAQTLSPSPKLSAALNTLRQTPAYPLSLRDRISLTFDIAAWHIRHGISKGGCSEGGESTTKSDLWGCTMYNVQCTNQKIRRLTPRDKNSF